MQVQRLTIKGTSESDCDPQDLTMLTTASLSIKPIIVHVGEEAETAKTWALDARRLSQSSDLFRRLLLSSETSFSLGDHPQSGFNIYANWLSRGLIFTDPNRGEDFLLASLFNLLIDAYLIGLSVEDLNFRDAIIDAMATILCGLKHFGAFIPPVQLRYRLYDKTPEGCTARMLLAHRCSPRSLHHLIGVNDHEEFLRDIRAQIRGPNRLVPTLNAVKQCQFHEHPPDRELPSL